MERSSQHIISRDVEIRNLSMMTIQSIAQQLAGDDTVLGLLMGNIVRDLDNPNSGLRFTSGDIDLIRNREHSTLQQITLLIDEWSTMGKIRPRVRHLLNLLVRCQLFRAADFVAQLLNEPNPERPATGPAAVVDISLPNDVETIVNGLDYPMSGELLNHNQPNAKPNATAPNMNFAPASSNIENNFMPFIAPPATSSKIFNGSTNSSNLMKFSKTAETVRPTSSTSTQPTTPVSSQNSELFIPMISTLQMPESPRTSVDAEQNIEHSFNLPALSGLMINGYSENQQSSIGVPALVQSMEPSNHSTSQQAENPQSEGYIPAFSAIFKAEPSTPSVSRISNRSSSSASDSDDND